MAYRPAPVRRVQIPKEGQPGKYHPLGISNFEDKLIQSAAILIRAVNGFFAVPLVSRIHEGCVFTNRDHRILLDKMLLMIKGLDLKRKFYFIGDAYYAAGKMVRGLRDEGNHNHAS